jgi:adenosine deaminase
MENNSLYNFLDKMPKVELHIHLEGSIPIEALWELVKKYNGKSEVKSIEALGQKFEYTDFPHFIQTWIWKNKFINEYDDFTFIASEFVKDMDRQNIIYSEVFYSPPDFSRKNLEPGKITEAIFKGIKKAEGKTKINLVADLVRDFGAEKGMKTLHQVNEVKDMGVVGIGIGGSEHEFPPELFAEVFEKARGFGFKTSAHAGEAAGSESIRGAIKALKVDRIGHGTRAFEDEKLVNYLREKQIPLEMCPLSNVRTGVVRKIEEHPVKDYYNNGLRVFLNTDDPKMFNNTLSEEYLMFVEKMGFGIKDVKVLMMSAIDSAWCSDAEKDLLTAELTKYFKDNN